MAHAPPGIPAGNRRTLNFMSKGNSMRTRKAARFLRLAALLAFWPVGALAGTVPVSVWQDYQSQGWRQIGEATGDLNRDGREDAAVVIEAPDGVTEPADACTKDDDYSDAPVRRLIVAFADGNGSYERAADEPRVVLRSDEGGVMGDPFDGVSVEHGSVVLNFYGGSRWRWGLTLRFRFDDGAWRMAGMTDTQLDSIANSTIEYDYNALSGKVQVNVEEAPEATSEPLCVACRIGEQCPEANGCYKGTKPARTGSTLFKVGRKERVLLSDYRCWENNTGLLAYTGFQSQR